jgi:hypothetical protein
VSTSFTSACHPCRMSTFRDARNQRSLQRLERALPEIFPRAVFDRAVTRPFIPPTPRLAIDGYWRAHLVRADRLARALAARSGAPAGWSWQLGEEKDSGLPATFRMPPAPYREKQFARGPGWCCVCGQPVYRFGWHADLWERGSNTNARWHTACVIAWQLWTGPANWIKPLKRYGRRNSPPGSQPAPGRRLVVAPGQSPTPPECEFARLARGHRISPASFGLLRGCEATGAAPYLRCRSPRSVPPSRRLMTAPLGGRDASIVRPVSQTGISSYNFFQGIEAAVEYASLLRNCPE